MPFPLRFPREMQWLLKAARLLGTIQGDPGRVNLVLELQQLLIRRIARSKLSHDRLQDARLRLKQRLVRERLIGEKARETKELVLKIQDRCDALEHLRFLYRCFGDGIAATYHPPQRHRYFYFAQRTQAKERAGLLSRQETFRRRYRALRLGTGMGIPVVLADVTNMVGQGDICVLAGSEPQPVELKSFVQRGRPGKLLDEELRRTMQLLAGAGPAEFHGARNAPPPEIHPATAHAEHLNTCVQQAMQSGIAQVFPEEGLRYVAIRTDHYQANPGCLRALKGMASKSLMSIQVAPEMAWVPMQPFTLSMTAENAVLFMQGAFQLFVCIDLKVLVSHFASLGVHAIALMDGVTALQISNDPEDSGPGSYRVSEVIFQRISCEFIALRSFAQEMAGMLEPAEAPGLQDAGDRDLLFAPPAPEWDEARHYYDEEGPRLH
ncbi:hypothetical protein [Acidovorax sp.]|uniref:hypothetical protein n=1 Tax=Acidovorax sp. TaxID=1872122 RepID=UPI003D0860EB